MLHFQDLSPLLNKILTPVSSPKTIKSFAALVKNTTNTPVLLQENESVLAPLFFFLHYARSGIAVEVGTLY
ncbi:hypothetical protein TMES_15935 [Thalassospira mesophila]|uniref:Uncharacterized protein n=1 Tax=Thalassospira mesophila TaxID=1293891 RepID=A0A1Y2KXA2_9PROT|nr:hypothetical protein TMES_15935 [Thalassospira mesophila]